jgi:hypothetical protein
MPDGRHAVLAVGYIPQAKLPPGTLNSTGGFYHQELGPLPTAATSTSCRWARAFIHSARPVGDVEVAGPLPDQPMDNFTFTPSWRRR